MKRTQHVISWLGVALACGLTTMAATKPPKPPPAPAGPTYRIVSLGLTGADLGTPPGAINASGWIVGRSQTAAFVVIPEPSVNGPVYFRDTSPADGFNDLMITLPGAVEGYSSAGAYGINDAGIIAGTSWIPSGTDLGLGSTIWMNGTAISIAEPIWMAGWYGMGFNNQGMTVGGRIGNPDYPGAKDIVIVLPEDTNGDGVPDRWFKDDNGDGANDLARLVARAYNLISYFEPMGMNDAGQIILAEQGGIPGGPRFLVTPDFADPDGDGNPWYADANNDGLNDLMTTLLSARAANDINSLGQVVGMASDGRAARWDIVNGTQTITYLGALGGSVVRMSGAAINNAGVVVGSSSLKNGGYEGFIYYKGSTYNLPACLVNATGWASLRADDINEQGCITGYGYLNGAYQAFVLIPVTQP